MVNIYQVSQIEDKENKSFQGMIYLYDVTTTGVQKKLQGLMPLRCYFVFPPLYKLLKI